MTELVKAFPNINQKRKLTSLEKGRMVVQILDEVCIMLILITKSFIGETTNQVPPELIDPSLQNRLFISKITSSKSSIIYC